MCVFLETKIRGVSEVQEVKSYNGETNKTKGDVLEVRKWD